MSYLLNDKLEEALVALVEPLVAELETVPDVVPGKDSGEKTLPIVICSADGEGNEDPHRSGNFWLQGKVTIKHSAVESEEGGDEPVDPKVPDEALVSAVFGGLVVDDIATQLSAAADDFTVFPNSVMFGSPDRYQDEQGVWIDELPFRAYCCARDLS